MLIWLVFDSANAGHVIAVPRTTHATAKAKTVFIIAPFMNVMTALPQATSFAQARAVGQTFDPTTFVAVEGIMGDPFYSFYSFI
jgi:hypothetical protein